MRVLQISTLSGDRHDVLNACRRYAQVVVGREAVAVQHLRPRVPEREHDGPASVPDALAQRPAGLYGLVQVVQADGSEKRAEELPRVGVTLLLNEGRPGRSLLQDLIHGFVSQQVREAHLRVLYVIAKQEVFRDLLAAVLFLE